MYQRKLLKQLKQYLTGQIRFLSASVTALKTTQLTYKNYNDQDKYLNWNVDNTWTPVGME